MYEIKLLNEKGETFVKRYDSYYLYNKALIKYKHSKKLKILYYGEVWDMIYAEEYVRRMKEELAVIDTANVVEWCRKQLQKSYNESKLTQLEIARDMILGDI